MTASMKNLGIYNEFGDMSAKNISTSDRQAVVETAYDRQLKTVNSLFKAIVSTIKDKWSKFMAMIDDNMAKLKNRIDVSNNPENTRNLKQAFFKMQQVKKFDNPMKRVLMKANVIYAKIKNVKDPQVILQAKEQLKEQRVTQKNIIESAKTTLQESKNLLKTKN